jgi:hypothetical protein
MCDTLGLPNAFLAESISDHLFSEIGQSPYQRGKTLVRTFQVIVKIQIKRITIVIFFKEKLRGGGYVAGISALAEISATFWDLRKRYEFPAKSSL